MIFLFFQKIGIGISCKFSPLETVCIKCQSLFSRKKNNENVNLSSAEFAKRERLVMVKLCDSGNSSIYSKCIKKMIISLRT